MFWFIFLKKMVQIRRCTPRQVRVGARGHVILCAYDAVASGVIERLERQRIAYYVIESDYEWRKGASITQYEVPTTQGGARRQSQRTRVSVLSAASQDILENSL